MSATRRDAIDVYAYVDYACPFSYVTDALLDRVLAGTELSARAFRRPLTFLGEEAAEGGVGPGEGRHGTVSDESTTREDTGPGLYGPEERSRIEREVGARAAALGIPFRMPERVPDPREALQAAEFAKDLGPDLFRRVHRALFGAVWAEGRDVGRRSELLDVSVAAGVDRRALSEALDDGRYRAELERAREEAERYRITGTPTLLVGRYKVVGAAPAEVMREALTRAARDPGPGPGARTEGSPGGAGTAGDELPDEATTDDSPGRPATGERGR